ncbi:hypothetical protein BsWGS_07404 [Bradybaena similaris]
MLRHFWLILLLCIHDAHAGVGMLYPRDSEARPSKLLDGVWHFRADFSPTRNQGFTEKWWTSRLQQWVNGHQTFQHEGGHLPFEGEVHSFLKFNSSNYMTVAVNNTLTHTTLPAGSIVFQKDTSRYPPGYFVQNLQMDFFNYAGIHRHVRLYTTPQTYIDDITILTNIEEGKGMVYYTVVVTGGAASSVQVHVLNANNSVVASSNKLIDMLSITSPHLWWPYGMNSSIGYLYTLEVKIEHDVYRQPFGIRTVRVSGNRFLINEKPFYCHGVSKHEDADFRGKGLDYTLIAKDFNMLRWLGVNCFRTSHYPYAEEIMDFADRQGVAVIDESPGVGLANENFGNVSLHHHLEVMSEMIRRDKNRPSVIMWSIANEPSSELTAAVPYFKSVLEFTRETDPAHRPTTFVSSKSYGNDKVIPFVDVICINRYTGWYQEPGHLEVIQLQVGKDLDGFRNLYNKPIILAEFGTDTVEGLHMEPAFMFTEEFQVLFLEEYHKVFDKARQHSLIGELVWNFADFTTGPGTTRVGGNRKGLLTRQRQPKAAAFVIRERYHDIANGGNGTCSYSRMNKYPTNPHTYQQHH